MRNRDELEALWAEHGWLVEHWTARWAAKAGRDPEDVRDAAVDAFLRAAETWDPEKGAAFPTWLTRAQWQRLRYWSQRQMELARRLPVAPWPDEELALLGDGADPLRLALLDLSREARQVVSLVLDMPRVFDSVSRPLRELRALAAEEWGWSRETMDGVVEEVREMLRAL